MNKNTYERIIDILNQSNIVYKIYEHEEVFTVEDVKSKLSFDYNKLFKTLVFINNEDFIFVVLNNNDHIDFKKLSMILNVKRDNLKMANSELIENKLGYQVGGISPIPVNSKIIVIFDKKILDNDTIYCGVGKRNKSLEIKNLDLIKISNAKVVDIIK